jgi:hypothetical protein
VLYNKNGKSLWATGTAGNAGDRLEVQTDGNLVVCVSPNSYKVHQVTLLVQVQRQRSEVGLPFQRSP